ncbi:MAG: hypothetical protein QF745_09980 [Planctomycetota bacterium]|jgi:hypothetical protein|nr:hypothetical protein [Planctomycetota bacterium]|tara:strand:- start:2845 stop:3093 length:249 start_codon:yes stop_codon:yes gene_type:complete
MSQCHLLTTFRGVGLGAVLGAAEVELGEGAGFGRGVADGDPGLGNRVVFVSIPSNGHSGFLPLSRPPDELQLRQSQQAFSVL